MRTVVEQLSTMSFVFLCVASSLTGMVLFPIVTATMFDLVGVSTDAPFSNFVGWSIFISAAVGSVFAPVVLMSARGDFD